MPSEYSFSTYDPKYKKEFFDLNAEWIQKYFRIEPKDLEQLENPEECLAEGGEVFFVVHDGAAVATCAMYNMGGGRYELAKMAVRPDYQGRGLSNILMERSEAWVRGQKDAKELYIRSNTVLTPAITLYKKHGYVEIPREGADPEYQRCNIEMIKPL
jgi:GNAT superfamily N-acetyltransferase